MLTLQGVLESVKQAAAEILGLEKEIADALTTATSLINDLEMDQIDLQQFLMKLEEKFNIKIPDDVAVTIGTLVDHIMKKLS